MFPMVLHPNELGIAEILSVYANTFASQSVIAIQSECLACILRQRILIGYWVQNCT